jgi:excisionase family DNA binding protein
MILEILQERKTVMNIHEVATLLGLSQSLIYRMAAANQIPSVRFCGALRFDPSELADWYRGQLNPFQTRKAPQAERSRMRRASIAS